MNKQQLQETEDKFRLDWERRSNCTACKVVWGSRGERNQGDTQIRLKRFRSKPCSSLILSINTSLLGYTSSVLLMYIYIYSSLVGLYELGAYHVYKKMKLL